MNDTALGVIVTIFAWGCAITLIYKMGQAHGGK